MIRGLYYVAYLFAMVSSIPLLPFNRKLREGWLGRWKLLATSRQRDSRPTLWFHVASSGEFEQALPLLDTVKENYPQYAILLTYFSPTAKRALELEVKRRNLSGREIPWDQSSFSPWDLPWFVRRFVKPIDCKAFIAIHRELWPGILSVCRKAGIPTYLVAGYFPSPTRKRLLGDLTGLAVTDRTSFENLSLFSEKTRVCGDPRIERVFLRKASRSLPKWETAIPTGMNNFVLASVWKEDFVVLSDALLKIRSEMGKFRFIVVPHEMSPSLLAGIEDWFFVHGLTLRRWTQWIESPDESSHLLVDQVGFLAELYSIADLVFVGGSFKGRVHNVLEPAVYGKPILVGPYIDNSREATKLAREPGLTVVHNADEASKFLKAFLERPESYVESGAGLIDTLSEELGASLRTLKFVLSH